MKPTPLSFPWNSGMLLWLGIASLFLVPPLARAAAPGPSLSASFSSIAAGSAVNLTSEGEIDWVH
jgi:hypothetical protein